MAYVGFQKLKGDLAHRKGVTNPGALAAYIGRKKYGADQYDAYSSKGKTMRTAKVKRPKS